MSARTASLLVAAALALVAGGCGGASNETSASTCERGFRAQAWADLSNDGAGRLREGKAIVKCGWFQGWSRTRVRRVLGATRNVTEGALYWELADDPEARGPALWELEVMFDYEGHVTSTHLRSRPY
jgi:hypothetical protein